MAADDAPADGSFRLEQDGNVCVIAASGRWTLAGIAPLGARLAALDIGRAEGVRFDLSRLDAMDTAGAFALHRLMRRLERDGMPVAIVGASPSRAALLARMQQAEDRKPLARPYVSPVREMVERVGRTAIHVLVEGRDLISFFGLTAITLARALTRPGRLRLIALLAHVERVGLNALPIVGLLSFLIGVVLSYQGADQLRQFGAEIYSVNLLGVSVLREIGVLITAIMVAGRSGSAFTAEIGTMKVNEEIDALKTLGLDPMEVLVLPRLLAVIIALPLLTFFSDCAALVGGAIMSITVLGLALPQFFAQLEDALSFSTFWVGLVKAPVFAFLIAMVGCYEGLQVEGGADSVGRMTTKSVVESIFLVIVADAGFSILFSYLGV